MDEAMLRECYQVLAACGIPRPPFEQWAHAATINADVWPIRRRFGDRMRIIGFVLFKGHSIHIAVEPAWQGRWATKTLLRIWREQYTHECDLYATPDAENKPARALAERLGFRLQRVLGQSAIYVKERKPQCPQL